MSSNTLQAFNHARVQVGRNRTWSRVSPKQPAPVYTVWLTILKFTSPVSRIQNYNQSYGFWIFSANSIHRSIGHKS